MSKRKTNAGKPKPEAPAENIAIVTIIRIVCDAKHWETDLYCPICKCYHTKHYKESESEPALVPTGVPAKDLVQYTYPNAPEDYSQRLATITSRKMWHT